MSSVLYWADDLTSEPSRLSDELKFIISRYIWDTDGTTGHGVMVLDKKDLVYLLKLQCDGVKDAKTLINGIKKHGKIFVWHEH